jgi:hypothetical protein
VFVGKLILDGFEELTEVESFISKFFINAWLAQEAPIEIRKIKTDKKLTKDQLPGTFDPQAIASTAVKRGFSFIEKIGPVQVNINLKISKLNNKYRLDIDKFSFEQNGAKLAPVVAQTLTEM